MSGGVQVAILGDRAVTRERGSAERREIDGELDVPDDVEGARDGAGGFDLTCMDLPVADREREQLVALRASDGAGGR